MMHPVSTTLFRSDEFQTVRVFRLDGLFPSDERRPIFLTLRVGETARRKVETPLGELM
jgi:hypothetical protein